MNNLSSASASLTLKHIPAGANGFFRAPVIISGKSEAVLIDGGFTYPDGRAVVAAIKETGKHLSIIYVSQSDPDYYFSLGPIRTAFPDVRVLAASETIRAIQANVAKKLAVWGPGLKENGPQKLDDIVMPEPFDNGALACDDETIEIVKAEGLANRRYLWVPSLRAIIGGVLVFSGVYVWTADTANAAERAAWLANLKRIEAHKPMIVVPGHMTIDAHTDLSGVRYTRDYLLAFEEELAKRPQSSDLIGAMKKRFPGLGMEAALDIGAKVATGEMTWG